MSQTLTVIVVNFNAGAHLLNCVRAAADQSDEIIVIDNASTDDSLSTLEEHAASLGGLSVIRNSNNVGFARACNMAAEFATGSLLLFLNPDCVLQPGSVAAMRRGLLADEGAGMAGGLLLNPDGSEQAGGRRLVPTPWRSMVRAFGLTGLKDRYPRLFEGYDLNLAQRPAAPTPVEAVSGACMLVRRQVLDQVGMLDERYFMHCEDLDWCMRFRQQGWRILFVPDAEVVHFKGVCSTSRPVFVEWHKHKGMVRFYRKFFLHQYPGGLMWLVAIGVWIRFLVVTISVFWRRVFRSLAG